ncbi:Importin-11 [Smittium mucronatum]|uniref:Importin-11 n=1 Tax=Smittium mucronatum TaxID=133383 RepID=A0A1R0GZJ9_9FUNG|nr:Importin-11 [Smittium mucronatum]
MIFKVILSLGKFYLEFSKYNPTSFILIERTTFVMQWYGNLLVSPKENIPAPFQFDSIFDDTELICNKIHLQSLLLFKTVVRNLSFESDSNSESENSSSNICSQIVNSKILNNEFLLLLINAIITKYMVLSERDIEKWNEEPEEWIIEEESDNWTIDVRSCSEKLFSELFMDRKELLLPHLLSNLENASEFSVQKKDALYTVAGLCAFEFSRSINFGEWLKIRLINDINQSYEGSEIIRRRVVWLIGKWVSNGLVSEYLGMCYEILLQCLSESEKSLVVKLSAVISINECFNDWSFDPDELVQYNEVLVRQLIQLLKNPIVLESKPLIIDCLSTFIERMRFSVKSVLPLLSEVVPSIWEDIINDVKITSTSGETNNPNSLKSLIDLTTNLVNSSGSDSVHLYNFVCPIIYYSCSPSPAQVYLQEHGVELWMATLAQSKCLTVDLVNLFGLVCKLVGGDNSEFMTQYFSILESYFFLQLPLFVFESDSRDLLNYENYMELSTSGVINNAFNGFEELISNFSFHFTSNSYNSKFFSSLISTLDYMFLSINYSKAIDKDKLVNILRTNNFLITILSICQENSNHSPITRSYAAALLARLIFIFGRNVNLLCELLSLLNREEQPPQFYCEDMTKVLLNNYDMLVYQKQRKLVCLALSDLVSLADPLVLQFLSNIILNVWLDFRENPSGNEQDNIYENKSDDPKKRMLLNRHIGNIWDKGLDHLTDSIKDAEFDSELGFISAESSRRLQFVSSDAAATTNALLYIKGSIQSCQSKFTDLQIQEFIIGDLDSDCAVNNLNFIKGLANI